MRFILENDIGFIEGFESLRGIRRLMSLKIENNTGLPIVSIGPGRIGDANQFEL